MKLPCKNDADGGDHVDPGEQVVAEEQRQHLQGLGSHDERPERGRERRLGRPSLVVII